LPPKLPRGKVSLRSANQDLDPPRGPQPWSERPFVGPEAPRSTARGAIAAGADGDGPVQAARMGR